MAQTGAATAGRGWRLLQQRWAPELQQEQQEVVEEPLRQQLGEQQAPSGSAAKASQDYSPVLESRVHVVGFARCAVDRR